MATVPKSSEVTPAGGTSGARIERFDAVERAVHWTTAFLFAVLILTGAALYLQPVAAIVGRRYLVEQIHVYCGIALPLPVLAALSGSWGRGIRADLKRFNRWTGADRAWLRATAQSRPVRLKKREAVALGKFNAGQKLNAAWTAGGGLVMLGTGLIMRFYQPWPLSWRTGATFVHDWLAAAIVAVAVGHIGMALRHPEALDSMRSGLVSRQWAAANAPRWLEDVDPSESVQPTS